MDAQPAHPKTDPQIAPLNCPGLSVITVRDILKSLSGTFRNHCPGLSETRTRLSPAALAPVSLAHAIFFAVSSSPEKIHPIAGAMGGHASNRLRRCCVDPCNPSTMIVPECSDLNGDFVSICADILAARVGPLIATTQPDSTKKSGAGGDKEHLVVMAHCATRSYSSNPSVVLHSASLRYGDSSKCDAATRLAPVEYATVARSLRSLRPRHSRIPPAHAFRPSWLRCERVTQ